VKHIPPDFANVVCKSQAALRGKKSKIEEVLFGFACYTSQGVQLDFSQTRQPTLQSCGTPDQKEFFA